MFFFGILRLNMTYVQKKIKQTIYLFRKRNLKIPFFVTASKNDPLFKSGNIRYIQRTFVHGWKCRSRVNMQLCIDPATKNTQKN